MMAFPVHLLLQKPVTYVSPQRRLGKSTVFSSVKCIQEALENTLNYKGAIKQYRIYN